MFFPLLALTAISASGLLIYVHKNISSRALNLLVALGAGSMLSVSIAHILPESLEQTENALYAFMAGFLAIYVIEELLTSHSHDHSHGDHSHEDPHEHYDHVALVSWIAIFVHTLFDGLGIRAGVGLSETVGYGVFLGVAIHQIPVSLSLTAIFRESKFRQKTQIFFLAGFACAASIGYSISDIFLANVNPVVTGVVAAFAGGSLLYVATVDLLPIIHAQEKKKMHSVVLFLIGAIAMTSVKLLG